tara:strand:- start:7251 stop:8357 length:1107 start_codon:yes stop_codon:yes gene_type:complete
MKSKIFIIIFGLMVNQIGFATESSSPLDLFNHDLTSKEASIFAKKNNKDYNKKNWLNPVLHNIFMINNRSETAQHRINLQNISKISSGTIKYLDLLADQPIDWTKLDEITFKEKVQKYHSIAGIVTTNLNKKNAPVIILFSSATHNLYSATTLDVTQDLTRHGFIVVMMEYPGYGGSMGTPSKDNWQLASDGLVVFIRKLLPENSIFLMGHSIGGPVALETAAHHPELISGVISHASFYTLKEGAKDSSKFFMSDALAPIVVQLFAANHQWKGDENLALLAKSGTPTLFLHGKNDDSVSYRHYTLFTAKAAELKKQYPQFPVFAKDFESSHEDVFANDSYGPYSEIWKVINDFVANQNRFYWPNHKIR